MASIGHVAVGMAMARAYLPRPASHAQLAKAMVVFGALAMLPDADAIGFRFGIAYGDVWGHRGATHSLMMALIAGSVTWLLLRALKVEPERATLFVTLTVMTHGLLDTLTTGGLGIELFWPYDTHRYFAPFRPIPVAPIGLGMLSARGLEVVAVELALFSPFFLYALWPRRQKGGIPADIPNAAERS